MASHKNENGISRCIVGIHGLAGYGIAVLGLVATLLFLGIWATQVQNDNAEVYYTIDQNLNSIKAQSINNNTFRIQE